MTQTQKKLRWLQLQTASESPHYFEKWYIENDT